MLGSVKIKLAGLKKTHKAIARARASIKVPHEKPQRRMVFYGYFLRLGAGYDSSRLIYTAFQQYVPKYGRRVQAVVKRTFE